jgi:hypothetical protein
MTGPDLMPDATVEKLRLNLAQAKSKPDQRRRWTAQLLERLLVAERAGRIILRQLAQIEPGVSDIEAELWHDAQHMAIKELRKEGRIK